MENAHKRLSMICKYFTCGEDCPLFNWVNDYCAYELLDKQIRIYKNKLAKEESTQNENGVI